MINPASAITSPRKKPAIMMTTPTMASIDPVLWPVGPGRPPGV
jgi:hypothetical protein